MPRPGSVADFSFQHFSISRARVYCGLYRLLYPRLYRRLYRVVYVVVYMEMYRKRYPSMYRRNAQGRNSPTAHGTTEAAPRNGRLNFQSTPRAIRRDSLRSMPRSFRLFRAPSVGRSGVSGSCISTLATLCTRLSPEGRVIDRRLCIDPWSPESPAWRPPPALPSRSCTGREVASFRRQTAGQQQRVVANVTRRVANLRGQPAGRQQNDRGQPR